jgi:predicted GH43/DUF377 family glycosyl hydrolase
MKWIKKGIIFSPNKNFDWLQTHAALPIPLALGDNNYRIYFSARNKDNIASIGFLELNINEPKKINYISEKPILISGNDGCFDDHGVMGHSLVNFENKLYFYYTGWNIEKNVPFRWSIGLAVSDDYGKTFKKISKGPILDRSTIDPFFVASPTVLFEDKLWKMWYVSGLGWEENNGIKQSPYHIRYAESIDGINWKRNGSICIDFANDNETRIGRASIIHENQVYKMWYSYGLEKYRIGYAESVDGINWNRNDLKSGIDVSESGWDSEMIEYTSIFENNGKKYMLYNGNDYGKTGFGIAIMENNH